MPTAVAIQCVEATTPKVPTISGRVVNGLGLISFKGRSPRATDAEETLSPAGPSAARGRVGLGQPHPAREFPARAVRRRPSSAAAARRVEAQHREGASPAPERISPTSSPSRWTGVPGAGRAPSMLTGNRRFFTRARYLVRAVSSWPM